jgi:predicted dehydrogenase
MQMIEAARQSGCLLMEAMVSTLNPNFIAVASRVGEIAPVRHYSSCFCQCSSKYEALKRGEVGTAFKPGTAGALRDVGVYTLYPLVSLFGRPSKVHGSLGMMDTPEGKTDVYGTAVLEYHYMDAVLT